MTSIDEIRPGYIGYVKSSGTMAKLIRFGEGLSGKAQVNHAIIFGDNAKVIQAEMKGVTYDVKYEDILAHEICYVVRPPLFVDLRKVVDFGEFYVGCEYGTMTDVAIGIDMVTAQWVPSFRGARKDSIICSALVEQALRFGGYLHHWVDVYSPTPQQSKDVLLSNGGTLL